MKRFLSYYLPIMPHRLVYMMQQVEYQPGKFARWLGTVPDLTRVMRRQELVVTRKAQGLLLTGYGVSLLAVVSVVWTITTGHWWLALLILLLLPVYSMAVLLFIVASGYKALNVVRRPLLGQAKAILNEHKATKIAVLGSYGNTTRRNYWSLSYLKAWLSRPRLAI